jgi:hypothetical protein
MGKMICVTEASHLCLAPQDVREGDVVSILVGGRILYILRPVPNGYRYIGEAFIHGKMHDEGWSEIRKPVGWGKWSGINEIPQGIRLV